MSNRIKNNLKNLVGQTLNQYYSKIKPTISDLRYKQEYQNRIIECMVGEVDDNYITTPETDIPITKLEYSKEGLVKVSTVKGKTILVDADGNETDTPAEGCKLLSVGEQEDNKLIILSNNANRFDYTDVENIKKHHYYTSTGEISGYQGEDSNDFCDLKFYNVKGLYGVTLINNNGELTPLKIVTYDKNKNFIRRIQQSSTRANVILESNEHYIRIGGGLSSISTLQLYNLSVTSLNYTPHKSYKTEILLDEPLKSLPDGVYDEIVNNQLIRRVGKVVLNGSENWRLNAQLSNDKGYYCFYCSDIKDGKMGSTFFPILSNRFVSQVGTSGNVIIDKMESEWVAWHGWSFKINICINGDKLITTDVNGFKQWLSENPTEVLYELAEPIIEELPNSITLQGFDDTTMYIENSITPTIQYGYNALIPYKEELSNQKEEVETNTLDIEQNIIPYLMDMEFNLMLMEDNE